MPDPLYDEQFVAKDSINGDLLVGLPYRIDGAGAPIFGRTDEQGRTIRVTTSASTPLTVRWGPAAGADSAHGQDLPKVC